MSIGGGIALFVIGAILAFAVKDNISGVDLTLIGDILMGAGVLVFILGLVFVFRKRSTVTTNHTVDGAGRERVDQVESHTNL